MSIIEQIPIDPLLPHTIILEPYLGDEGAGGSWDDEITILHVYVEPNKKYARGLNGFEVISNAILIIDGVNSVVEGTGLPLTKSNLLIKSKVTFDNIKMQIVENPPSYAGSSNVHHWEIVLK